MVLIIPGIWNLKKSRRVKSILRKLYAQIAIATGLLLLITFIWHVTTPYLHIKEDHIIVNKNIFINNETFYYENVIDYNKDLSGDILLRTKEKNQNNPVEISLSVLNTENKNKVWRELQGKINNAIKSPNNRK
ncbi:MAG: hypothetical protein GY754_34835 [bacterium]|nr:hypothetical protein [bacterium]